MRRLVDHGREGGGPSFYFKEYAAPAGCPVDDEQAWAAANPALDDFLHRDALRATLPPKMREAAFRRYRQEHKDSPRRIDAAVCMVMAVHRAAELADSTPAIYA